MTHRQILAALKSPPLKSTVEIQRLSRKNEFEDPKYLQENIYRVTEPPDRNDGGWILLFQDEDNARHGWQDDLGSSLLNPSSRQNERVISVHASVRNKTSIAPKGSDAMDLHHPLLNTGTWVDSLAESTVTPTAEK